MLLSGTYGHKHGCMSDKQPLRFTDKETTGEGSCKSKPSGNEHGNHCQSSSERRNKDYIVTEIPPPTTLPDIRKVSSKEFNKVVIDLETSSRGRSTLISCIIKECGSHLLKANRPDS